MSSSAAAADGAPAASALAAAKLPAFGANLPVLGAGGGGSSSSGMGGGVVGGSSSGAGVAVAVTAAGSIPPVGRGRPVPPSLPPMARSGAAGVAGEVAMPSSAPAVVPGGRGRGGGGGVGGAGGGPMGSVNKKRTAEVLDGPAGGSGGGGPSGGFGTSMPTAGVAGAAGVPAGDAGGHGPHDGVLSAAPAGSKRRVDRRPWDDDDGYEARAVFAAPHPPQSVHLRGSVSAAGPFQPPRDSTLFVHPVGDTHRVALPGTCQWDLTVLQVVLVVTRL